MKILVLIILCFTAFETFGQSKSDTIAINEACMNYIEGYYTANADRMSKALHPELSKRAIFNDGQGDFLFNVPASMLVAGTKGFNKPLDNSNEPFKANIRIFDISYGMATVKVTNNKLKLIDYLHLGEVNGEWKIINVLWAEPE